MTLWRKRQIEKLKQQKETAMKEIPMILIALIVVLMVYGLAAYLDEQSELEEFKCFVVAGDHPPQRVQVPCKDLK
jgi:hypothetical protein